MNNDIEFQNIIKELKEHDDVKSMKKYTQHFNTSCYEHCMNVAYYSYLKCKKHGLDYKSAARAGLLHDLFLYDWHDYEKKSKLDLHGFTHPKKAYLNAKEITKLNDIEKDCIIKHMWPLTVKLPKYKETWIITLMDKLCTIDEYLKYKKETKRKNKLATVLSTILIALIIKI